MSTWFNVSDVPTPLSYRSLHNCRQTPCIARKTGANREILRCTTGHPPQVPYVFTCAADAGNECCKAPLGGSISATIIDNPDICRRAN
ncbi:hypothetical protein H4Q26_007360 [Puccinia striiformis f. sp. tritici PST-130]|nr:hypothetical protein H4Q26_007360 [Puccinia striiformis f. sp. tritici PST-130]